MFQGMAFALAYLPDYQTRLQAERERALTPEELLAALESAKSVTLDLAPSQQLRASLNTLVDWWLDHVHPAVIALSFVLILVLIAVFVAEVLRVTLHL